MAYAPIKTWLGGDVVLASDVQGNLDGLKEYLHKIEAGAIRTTPWVDTKHIVKGRYDAVTNMTQFVSGTFGGQTYTLENGVYTYATAYNTGAAGSNVQEQVPLTGLTLTLYRPATVFFQWWATGNTKWNSDAATGYAEYFLYLGSKSTAVQSHTASRLYEEDTTIGSNYLTKSTRCALSGFEVKDFALTGTYDFGVMTTSTTSKSRIYSWGVSIEAFYL